MNEQGNLSTADFAVAAERHERPAELDAKARERDAIDNRETMSEREREDRHATARDIHETRAEGLRAPPAERVVPQPQDQEQPRTQGEQLVPLFLPQMAQNFRSKWDEVQIGFVDDPVSAVRRADELVAQVMKNLAQTFADERAHLEGEMNDGDTEHMRVALRRYRSFFQRLLSL